MCHSGQMSQRSKVSKITLWSCSQNVIVFVFVSVFVLVRSCCLITLACVWTAKKVIEITFWHVWWLEGTDYSKIAKRWINPICRCSHFLQKNRFHTLINDISYTCFPSSSSQWPMASAMRT